MKLWDKVVKTFSGPGTSKYKYIPVNIHFDLYCDCGTRMVQGEYDLENRVSYVWCPKESCKAYGAKFATPRATLRCTRVGGGHEHE